VVVSVAVSDHCRDTIGDPDSTKTYEKPFGDSGQQILVVQHVCTGRRAGEGWGDFASQLGQRIATETLCPTRPGPVKSNHKLISKYHVGTIR
jgi:hypothetical protein